MSPGRSQPRLFGLGFSDTGRGDCLLLQFDAAASGRSGCGHYRAAAAEQALPVRLSGLVQKRETDAFVPPVSWIPVEEVADDDFPVAAGEVLMAIDTAILQRRIDERQRIWIYSRPGLAVSGTGRSCRYGNSSARAWRQRATAETVARTARPFICWRRVESPAAAASVYFQHQQRLGRAQARLQALQQVADAGFPDAPALQRAQRQVADLTAQLQPILLEYQTYLAETARESGEIRGQSALTALIDLEREIIDLQLRRNGFLDRRRKPHYAAGFGKPCDQKVKIYGSIYEKNKRDQVGVDNPVVYAEEKDC